MSPSAPMTTPLEFRVFDSPLGPLTAVASADALRQLSFADLPPPGADEGESALFDRLGQLLAKYFSGARRHFDLPLDLTSLSPFARQVLATLAETPYGSTVQYAELAAQAGYPNAARAVGNVLARNPLPLLLPCHRVLPRGGRTGNYTGGRERKRWLLDLESRT